MKNITYPKLLDLLDLMSEATSPEATCGSFKYGSAQLLASDMSKLVNRKLFSDVQFVVGQSRKKIYAHKCILSARNAVLGELFSKNQAKNSFELPNSHPVTFLLLIYFLYTNSISFDHLSSHEVFELMLIAEEYKCMDLCNLAERQLCDLIDSRTVLKLYSTATESGHKMLADATLAFIEEHSTTILTTSNEELLSLSADAMKNILSSDLLNLDELIVIAVACYWAGNHLQQAKIYCVNQERVLARDSLLQRNKLPLVHGLIKELSMDSFGIDENALVPQTIHENFDGPAYMQRIQDDICRVMDELRLTLLLPNELAELEEEQLNKQVIPKCYFIDAWRLMALPRAIDDVTIGLKHKQQHRRGTIARLKKQKSSPAGLLNRHRLISSR